MKAQVVKLAVIGCIKAIIRHKTDPSKDFGFIQIEGEIDVYNSGKHFNVLRSDKYKQVWNKTCYPDPHVGDLVQFDIVLDKSGRETCVNVVKIGRAAPQPTTAQADPTYREIAKATSKPVPQTAPEFEFEDEEEEEEDYLIDIDEEYDDSYDDEPNVKPSRQKPRKQQKKGGDDDE